MGYDVARFASTPSEAIICAICKDVCEEPVECTEEHIFCKSCIQQWLILKGHCPLDRQAMSATNLKPASRVIRQIIGNLQIMCQFTANGCDIVTTVAEDAEHVKVCEFNAGLATDLHEKTAKRLEAMKVELKQLSVKDNLKDAAIKQLMAEASALASSGKTMTDSIAKLKEEMQQEFAKVKKDFSGECAHMLMKMGSGKEDNPELDRVERDLELLQIKLDEHLAADIDQMTEAIELLKKEKNGEKIDFGLAEDDPTRLKVKSNGDRVSRSSRRDAEMSDDEAEAEAKGDGKEKVKQQKVKSHAAVHLVGLTVEDFGRTPDLVSENHYKMIARYQQDNRVKSNLCKEILYSLDFADFFPEVNGGFEKTGGANVVKHLNHLANTVTKGMKILLTGGNAYVAMSAAILSGRNGTVYCTNFGRGLVEAAGYVHLLDSKRMNFIVSPAGFPQKGYAPGAPYDLILVPTAKYSAAMKAQLEPSKGKAFDYNAGNVIKACSC